MKKFEILIRNYNDAEDLDTFEDTTIFSNDYDGQLNIPDIIRGVHNGLKAEGIEAGPQAGAE